MDNFLKEVICENEIHISFNIVQNSIIRKKKQGKSSLEGNQSQDFLKKTGRLEEAFFRAGSVAVMGLPFIASLRSFSQVVDQCFQVQLKENYKDSIKKFEQKYRELEITVTPKVLEKDIIACFNS